MLSTIYVQSMGVLTLLACIGMILYRSLWSWAWNRGHGGLIQGVTGGLLGLWILGILWATLGRAPGQRQGILIPFYSLYLGVTENHEMFRSMFMNVLLFLPGGFLLGLLDGKGSVRRKAGILILSSLVIELLQFGFCLGKAEVDDVICNGLGAILGILAAKFGSK